MSASEQIRHVGDTEVVLAVTLERPDGTVVNLSGLTVKFTLVDSVGADKVAETDVGVTVTNAAAGEVQYAFKAADVNMAGTYAAYFIVIDGAGNRDTFPVRRRDLQVSIHGD